MAEPFPATKALLRVLYQQPDGAIVAHVTALQEAFDELDRSLAGSDALPALREFLRGLGYLAEKAGLEAAGLKFVYENAEAFFAARLPDLEKRFKGTQLEIKSALEAPRKSLATLSPEPTGPQAEARGDVPFTKPKNVKG